MTKEGFIDNILTKLHNNIQLTDLEIRTISRALRESSHCFQEPYYEVVYHDEYGNKEIRIMNPVSSKTLESIKMAGYALKEDHFDLVFRRIVPKEK